MNNIQNYSNANVNYAQANKSPNFKGFIVTEAAKNELKASAKFINEKGGIPRIKEQAREKIAGAFLVGERGKIEDQECVFVTGAVKMQVDFVNTGNLQIDDEMMIQARKDCGDYFPGQEIVGWMLVEVNGGMGLSNTIIQCHEKYFAEKNSIFVQKHPVEGEELYFVYKFHELMQLGGHYIFYEKNPAMQNYMINVRRQIGVTPSEMVEDRAAKNFRSAIRGKIEYQEKRENSHFLYAMSVFLVVIVLAIGISTMNNFDKMEAVQQSVEALSQAVGQPQVMAGDEEDLLKKEENAAIGDERYQEVSADEQQGENEESEFTGTMPEVSTIQEQLNADNYYIVKKGDTLDSISRARYGTSSQVDAICRMNGLDDGNLIFIGQKLLLP